MKKLLVFFIFLLLSCSKEPRVINLHSFVKVYKTDLVVQSISYSENDDTYNWFVSFIDVYSDKQVNIMTGVNQPSKYFRNMIETGKYRMKAVVQVDIRTDEMSVWPIWIPTSKKIEKEIKRSKGNGIFL